jgi:hypothetical protein
MIAWLWHQTLDLFSDLEGLFVEGRIAPRPPPSLDSNETTRVRPPAHMPQVTPSLFAGQLPDWMQPPPSAQPRKALPMEVVAALMALGLASPPAKDQLKRQIRRALADAHPDRHAVERHPEMAQRLHEIQQAREVLRRHGFA